MSDVDWAVVAVETELEIERAKRERESNSHIVQNNSGSNSGCISGLGYILLGILVWRLLLEIFSFFI